VEKEVAEPKKEAKKTRTHPALLFWANNSKISIFDCRKCQLNSSPVEILSDRCQNGS
jgi:hypothetical protein